MQSPTGSITIAQTGKYWIYATPWYNTSGNWTLKQGSTVLYNGTNAWYNGIRNVSANTVISLIANSQCTVIQAFRIGAS